MLVWKTTTLPVNGHYSRTEYLVTADVVDNAVTRPDTIARVDVGAFFYSGTAWGARRWVAVRDNDLSVLGAPEVLRIFRSDEPGHWRQMGATGMKGSNGMRLAAIDTNTVMMLSSDFLAGVRWGYLRDTTFVEELPQLTGNILANGPALARRPSGGYWTGWDIAPDILPDYADRIVLRSYRDGVWAAPDTLAMRWPVDRSQLFVGVELGAEGSEIPAVAWFGYSFVGDVAWYVWTSFPSDSGFGVGERLEGSWNGIGPTLVRDENGDVWLAWWRLFDGVYWVHSYTTATCTPPVLSESAGRPMLRWQLSEPAPETWWAVLRAEGGGLFERIARVRATADTSMVWADTSAPEGVALRYAIRRECRDVRYQWTSAEASWQPRGPSLAIVGKSGNPATDHIEFEIFGANQGALDVRLYDLQGRQVLRQSLTARGTGRDAASVALNGRLRAGLYLMRVRSADGRLSPATKFAIVR
jgi:hypothetical protein